MPIFKLELSDGFRDDYKNKDPRVQKELDGVLRFLQDPGPTYNSLNSHKIEGPAAKDEGQSQIWESYVTWSHRITWHYKPGRVIFLRSTDGHEILPRR
jgi:mRNA-degrading endonuclease YafQ of YafQ-DinJ toxin-antitoxin module